MMMIIKRMARGHLLLKGGFLYPDELLVKIFFFFFFFFLIKIFSTGRSLLLLLACNYSLLIFWFNFFRWPVFKQQISITAPSNGASWASNTFFVFEEIGVWFRPVEMKCNETGSLDDDSVSNKNFVNASSISSVRHSDGSPFSHALLTSVSKNFKLNLN